MHLAQHRKRFVAIALLSVVASLGLGVSASPAHAVTTGVGIDVNVYGAADGSVEGIGGPYTSVLTATGAGTCALDNSPVTIAAFAEGKGNPSLTHTNGSVCALYDGTVEYVLTYTSLLNGVTSAFYRSCDWVLGFATCSPQGYRL